MYVLELQKDLYVTVTDKLQMQERELKAPEQDFAGEKTKIVDVQTDENVKAQTNTNLKTISDTSIQQQINTTVQQQTSESGLSSLFSILPSASDINPTDELQPLKPKKKKKRKPRLSG